MAFDVTLLADVRLFMVASDLGRASVSRRQFLFCFWSFWSCAFKMTPVIPIVNCEVRASNGWLSPYMTLREKMLKK